LLALACLSLLSEAILVEPNNNNSTNLYLRRNLQASSKKIRNKQGRASKLLELIEKTPIPDHFVPTPESAHHNPLGPAVFTSAMDVSYSK
jgi:hypothetical protein